MNDRETAKAMRLIAECERRSGSAQPKTIEMLQQGAARLDALRWRDIGVDGPPDLRNGEYVLVVGYEDRIKEVSTPIRCWGGVYENRYWRYPEHPTRSVRYATPPGAEGGGA